MRRDCGLSIFDLGNNHELSDRVCKILDVENCFDIIKKFKDGETDMSIPKSVRGKDVFVFQEYAPPIGERLYELENFCNAVRGGGSSCKINTVLPYTFGSRGDRRTKSRESIQAGVVAKKLHAAKVSTLITVEIHTTTIEGIYDVLDISFENISFDILAANVIINNSGRDIIVASPDVGGVKRNNNIIDIASNERKDLINIDLAMMYKRRVGRDKIKKQFVLGDIKGKEVFIYDDIAGTLGTAELACEEFICEGAESLSLVIAHPVLTEGYEEKMEKITSKPKVKNLYFGNTIPLKEAALKNPKIKIIPVDPLIAESIRRVHENSSEFQMSDLYKYKKVVEVYKKAQEKISFPENYVKIF